MKVLRIMDEIEIPDGSQSDADIEINSEHGSINEDDMDDDKLQTAAYVVSKMKSHITVQLLILQVPSINFPCIYIANTPVYLWDIQWFSRRFH